MSRLRMRQYTVMIGLDRLGVSAVRMIYCTYVKNGNILYIYVKIYFTYVKNGNNSIL